MNVAGYLKGIVAKFYEKAVVIGGALDEYLGAIILLVVIGVAASIGAYIMTQVQSQILTLTNSTSSYAYEAAGYATQGVYTFSTWLPLLATVIVAVVIIALLYTFFRGGTTGRVAA